MRLGLAAGPPPHRARSRGGPRAPRARGRSRGSPSLRGDRPPPPSFGRGGGAERPWGDREERAGSPGSRSGTHRNRPVDTITTWVAEADIPQKPELGRRRKPPTYAALEQELLAAEAADGSTRVCLDSEANRAGPTENRATPPENRATLDVPPRLQDQWASRRAAHRHHLARAREWNARIRSVEGMTASDLAPLVGATSSRIRQLIRLLKLSPTILADLEAVDGTEPVPTERALHMLTRIETRERQEYGYRRLCADEATRSLGVSVGRTQRLPQKGFQHLFRQARRYRSLLDTGAAPSKSQLARNEEVSPRWVRQLLNLLHLAPEIIAQIDVPAGDAPPGVTGHDIRRIVRNRDHHAQLQAWAELTGRAVAKSGV